MLYKHLGLLFPILGSAQRPSTSLRGGNKHSGSPESCLVCNVGKLDVQFKQNHPGKRSDFFVCETKAADDPTKTANQVYLLEDLPLEFLKQYKDRLENGKSRICIPQGKPNRTTNKVDFSSITTPKYLGEQAIQKHGHHRHLMNSPNGSHTVLAVVVSSTAGEVDPIATPTAVAGNIFGVGSMAQTVNVASQYKACSNGKLQIYAATGRNVVNGVLSVTISTKIAGSDVLGLQNTLVTAVNNALGFTDIRYAATHVLFCLPNGGLAAGSPNWISFGYTNGQISFHQNSNCARLSAPMHEIGHNIGFWHSGLAATADEYGDTSGYMGYSYNLTGHPLMCFNAQKNWFSGWFDDRKITINPFNGPWIGTLTSFVDYSSTTAATNSVVLINVGNLYLQLNSAKKYNNETKTNPNQVNLVSADVPSNPNTRSWLMAGLVAGRVASLGNFNGNSSATLVIQVCSITLGTVDTAQVSIYLKNSNYSPSHYCSSH